jgi:hypothetical protein
MLAPRRDPCGVAAPGPGENVAISAAVRGTPKQVVVGAVGLLIDIVGMRKGCAGGGSGRGDAWRIRVRFVLQGTGRAL